MSSNFQKGLTLLCLAGALSVVASAEDILPEPTLVNVAYGPHERNVLDFWKADIKKPAPMLFIIHGGGWLHNDKSRFIAGRHRKDIQWFLDRGISIAAINYRYSKEAPLPAPVHDAARALQYLRSRAEELSIDKNRIAASGASAGGCTALWLATHDDLADPNSKDPVLRESTRLSAAWVLSAQTSIDPMTIKEWFGEIPVTHPMIHSAAGFQNREEMIIQYSTKADVYREFSPVTHLSADDPPILLTYHGTSVQTNNGIHHAIFGLRFKEQANKVGTQCILDMPQDKTLRNDAPHWRDFIVEQLKNKGS